MNELLTVNYDTKRPTVSARDLYGVLEPTERFSSWFDRNSQYLLIGEDFNPLKSLRVQTEGQREVERELDDYELTVDAAKQICMVQRTEKGRECRQYFIDLEKAWNTPEQIMARALKVADARMKALQMQLTEARPKIEFFDAVANSKTAMPMDQVAKVLDVGIGRNKLFEILREKRILDRSNVPYQEYVDRGYFRVIEQKYVKPNGDTVVTTKTLVYQRGLEYIRKIVA